MTVSEVPISYNLKVSYSHKNLYLSALFASPFTRHRTKTTMETMPYSQFRDMLDRTQSQYCNLSLTYTFDFGRKTKQVESNIDKSGNSSLLRI